MARRIYMSMTEKMMATIKHQAEEIESLRKAAKKFKTIFELLSNPDCGCDCHVLSWHPEIHKKTLEALKLWEEIKER